jgi:amino acid adenylation domain-containing protein
MKPLADMTQPSGPRQKLLEYLLEKEGISATKPIGRVARAGNLPLSPAQERIWFLEQLEPGTSTYTMGGALRLLGLLDVPALEGALNSIVVRHESLRTTYYGVDGKPVQVIADRCPLSVEIADLLNTGHRDSEAELQQRLSVDVRRPFDLERGPLIRVKLFRLAQEEHILLLTMHHIIGDAWSMGILVREMTQAYGAFCTHDAPPLPELAIQYADYAEWQREWFEGSTLEREVAYWKKQLGGKLPILDLPADRPRPATQSFNGAHLQANLPRHLLDGLKESSKRENVTLFMTLLAAFQTLLMRSTDQEDIIVGTPVAGRSRPETETLIGLFINTLVMRTDLSGNPTFRELLGRVRNVVLSAFEHQDLPFGKLVAELQPQRDLSHPPVFQVMMVMQNAPTPNLRLPGLVLTSVEIDSGVSKLDLTLEVKETEDGLTCRFEYNTDLFESATIERMAIGFRVVLEALVENPEQRIWGFFLLNEAERDQILRSNQTESAFPRGTCVHELIEEQAILSPQAIAVSFGELSLTYGELNARSNQLAHYLRSRGVRPETLVGVLLERSLDMVVGLLGILKAGGAYVPLDPSYPRDRISFMIEDSRMPLVLTHREEVPELTASGVEFIRLDSDGIAKESVDNPSRVATPDDLAYVIYTSGSTGKPKGVQIPHCAVVNFLTSMRREPGMAAEDVLLAVTTLSFDIAGLELYLPLTVGARIVIASREATIDATKLGRLLLSSGATVMQATPATWRMLIEAGWEGDRRLKILCGGEALPRDLADKLLTRSASLWNLYGPTETTIWSAVHKVSFQEGPVVIGRAIANTQMYVLDRQRNLVPIGVRGELHIGGVGLARGYWNRPELTAEKFIPDPFRSTSGAQLYKTGDLVRQLPDGTIEFLGRIDHQVKIRGFRIELGEIETILQLHPDVQECVVATREDAPGDHRLVAYFVPAGPEAPPIHHLRAHLRQALPEHMLPSAFVSLGKLPLTPNGKLDRRALPAPDETRPQLDVTYALPRNEIEKSIALIWQQILRVERVGRDDNFFDLGGHSLLMVQVHSAIRKSFPTDVSMIDMFRYPTVGRLAEYLGHGAGAETPFREVAARVAIRRESINRQRQTRLLR